MPARSTSRTPTPESTTASSGSSAVAHRALRVLERLRLRRPRPPPQAAPPPRQIDELQGKLTQQSLTLVPLSIYFKDGRAKVELALARGRHLYDKRHALAERDANREAERAIRALRAPLDASIELDRRTAVRWTASRDRLGRSTQGVTGFDFGRRGGRSEPWSPEPR